MCVCKLKHVWAKLHTQPSPWFRDLSLSLSLPIMGGEKKLVWLVQSATFITCGRRPAGHVMMAVVGVVGVVVVVVVVVVVGGEQLLYIGSPRAHVWSSTIKENLTCSNFILKAHVWFASPCMVCKPMYG